MSVKTVVSAGEKCLLSELGPDMLLDALEKGLEKIGISGSVLDAVLNDLGLAE